MTREERIANLKILKSRITVFDEDDSKQLKALQETIKELEQEPILDKIRVEIEALPKVYPFVTHINTYVKEDDVRRIINKYKSKIGLSVQGEYPEVWIGDQAEEGEKDKMIWGDLYDEFCEKFPNADVEDYRPAVELHIPQLARGIPNAIIVWLKDGSKVIYIAKSEGETNGGNSI